MRHKLVYPYMYLKIILLFLFLCINGILFPIESISIEQLHHHNGEKVQTRGFLYQADNGEWILDSRPDLKSCCVGKSVGHVVVDAFIDDKPNRAVNVEGTLIVAEGRLTLKDAHILPRNNSIALWSVLGSIFSIAILAVLIKKSSQLS